MTPFKPMRDGSGFVFRVSDAAFGLTVDLRFLSIFSQPFSFPCPILRSMCAATGATGRAARQIARQNAAVGRKHHKNPLAGNGTNLLRVIPAGGNEVQSNSQTEGNHA
ncbi:hypothetical protein [Paraburkholderia hayleyella]|uniref:hypothetical protein n=1 Tax=Paraburkholderia hayleyella TaxID=2152889 RepID=UPI00129116C7|nr:hypothetical protein [Paraburkholderia hayleyella]